MRTRRLLCSNLAERESAPRDCAFGARLALSEMEKGASAETEPRPPKVRISARISSLGDGEGAFTAALSS